MTTKHVSRTRHDLTTLTGLGLSLGALAACQLSSHEGAAQFLDDCPKDAKLATSVHLDVSGSFITSELDGQRLAILRDAIARTAACKGHLQVKAFAGSGAGTAVLFDDGLQLKGSTDNARLRRIPALVDDITDQVAAGYGDLPTMTGGTDVVGQLRGAREYIDQLGGGYTLWAIVATDGLQTAGVRTKRLTQQRGAEQEAGRLPVTDLSNAEAEVLFVGIGNTTDRAALRTSVVNAVKSFYEAICKRLSAKRCQVATDYTSIGS